jgi:4-hydroxyacetophenone monooxygenase
MNLDVERDRALNEQQFRAAMEKANVPSLLPTLYQLTGDVRWLAPQYRPERTRGFDELNSGGLSEELQAEVREGAVRAVIDWANGAEPAVERPSAEELTQLMSTALGEPVDPEYAPMVATHLGFEESEPEDLAAILERSRREFSVAIIGAGISGMAAAVALRKVGIPFTMIEKNEEVGGTWWENDYPGARVDIPTVLYSFSFFRRQWSEHFGQRDELAEYLLDAADHFGLRDHIRFGHEVLEACWGDADQCWTLTMRSGDGETVQLTANAVISAVGLHNRPKVPVLPGIDEFKGELFHSARWPENARLDGKRVGVMGSGASAMQVVAAIVDRVRSLTIFQRSAHWIIPNPYYFRSIPEATNWLFDHVPFYRLWYRFRLHWLYAERIYPALVVDPNWDLSRNSVNAYSEANRKFYTAYINSQLEGREDLIERATPTFPPFGKRLLIDNGWYAALKRQHVELVTESIERLTPDGVVTKGGRHHELDVLVLCTGFQQQRYLHPMHIYGVGGRALHEEWHGDDARAHLGITSPGFPNLFYLFGPNTNPPGGSWITVAEDQVRYIVGLLTTMVRDDIASVEVQQDRHDDYNQRVDELNSELVLALEGIDSYYRNASGRVVTNSPWTILEYWKLIREPDLDDFIVKAMDAAGAR